MTTWYVRPDTSHNGSRNGTTYAKAWGGWTEIVWGGAGVIAGDTLYVCGAHSYGSILAIGAHGATVSSRVTIRGDYIASPGSITMTAGPFYFNINRSYTTLANITISAGNNRCIVFTGIPLTGVWIQNCILNGAASPCIEMLSINTYSYVDIIISNNTFNGGTGGGGGAGLYWSPQSAITTSISNLQITNNVFNGCSAVRGVIVLKPGNAVLSGTKMADIDIHGNTFTNCGGATVEAYGPEVFGRNTGIKIYDNIIRNQVMVGGLGGGFALGGFVNSLNPDFGQNLIYGNKAYGLAGPTGFCNPMYGSYTIFNNYAEDISTTTIDGCGILFDHGADGCTAYGNVFKRITGTGNPDYISGAGIGVIYDATNITAFGNIVDGCVIGVLYGNQTPGRVTNIYNNHFLNCSLVGMSGNATTYGADSNLARNNILTTAEPSVPAVRYISGAWRGETRNNFYGFRLGTQTLHATDLTVPPQLDVDYRPHNPALKRTGIYLGGKDLLGKQFYNPPNIGAVDDTTSTPRYLLPGT